MKTITGVPESITRADYLTLITSVGFDPNRLRALEFRTDGIYAVVKEVDENGRSRIEGYEVVTNQVYIPVKG